MPRRQVHGRLFSLPVFGAYLLVPAGHGLFHEIDGPVDLTAVVSVSADCPQSCDNPIHNHRSTRVRSHCLICQSLVGFHALVTGDGLFVTPGPARLAFPHVSALTRAPILGSRSIRAPPARIVS